MSSELLLGVHGVALGLHFVGLWYTKELRIALLLSVESSVG
jgi:hypothetical protein